MKIIPVLHNIRSAHNVGSIMRTAEALGCTECITIGITPHMRLEDDERLPHVIARAERQIKKTSLGAEEHLTHRHLADEDELIALSIKEDFQIVALEQDERSIGLHEFKQSSNNIALVCGPEATGFDQVTLNKFKTVIEITQYGKKNSLNVSNAMAIAIYELTKA